MKINPTLLGFIKKEFVQALRDPRMRIMLFAAPVLQMTLFGVALSSEVKNIRLSMVSTHNDRVLQETYQRALSSGWFIPANTKHVDPYLQIQSGEADAVLVPPPEGLTNALERGEGRVQLLVNASNVLRAQSVEAYIKGILPPVALKEMRLDKPPSPIVFDMRIFYNPTMRTAVFMVPGVMSMLICLITILLTSMSVSKEKESGTFEMLISAPVKPQEIILGKTLPYVILGLSNIPLILGVAILGFGVPMRGSFLVLLLASLVFVCVTVSIGTLISTITKTQQQSMMAGFLFLFPAVQLSGLMFPLENMPGWMKFLAHINPLTHFLEMLRNIMLKGGDLEVILYHLGVLIVMAIVVVWYSFKRFHSTLG
ncbi:ABC transporter permease [Bdellovibrio sp. HCB337]|uniref:ABC transporter permease n=1 Tax=Bdellovibrio sp. HCB337 TaxID=3394358 RepID=UPI0039A52729